MTSLSELLLFGLGRRSAGHVDVRALICHANCSRPGEEGHCEARTFTIYMRQRHTLLRRWHWSERFKKHESSTAGSGNSAPMGELCEGRSRRQAVEVRLVCHIGRANQVLRVVHPERVQNSRDKVRTLWSCPWSPGRSGQLAHGLLCIHFHSGLERRL